MDLRIGVLGLGDIAQKAYLPLICQHAGVRPLLCSRDGARLQALSQRYRTAGSCQTLAELLAQQPDAVMLHSSSDSHFALASQILQAGIPLFIDKPLCLTLWQSEQLLNLASQRNLLLFCGFNRRYAPLYQPLLQLPLQRLHYQKHRYQLAAPARTFILDDFIHLLDFTLWAGNCRQLPDISQHTQFQGELLTGLFVRFQAGELLLSADMNRLAGQSMERLEAFSPGCHFQIDNLSSGVQATQNQSRPLGFDDWTATLEKRGFVAMLQHFLQLLQQGNAEQRLLDSYALSHQAAELLIERAERPR